jgi:hypothetical protein
MAIVAAAVRLLPVGVWSVIGVLAVVASRVDLLLALVDHVRRWPPQHFVGRHVFVFVRHGRSPLREAHLPTINRSPVRMFPASHPFAKGHLQ